MFQEVWGLHMTVGQFKNSSTLLLSNQITLKWSGAIIVSGKNGMINWADFKLRPTVLCHFRNKCIYMQCTIQFDIVYWRGTYLSKNSVLLNDYNVIKIWILLWNSQN